MVLFSLKIIQLVESLFNGLSSSENVNFHLLFGHAKETRDIPVRLALKIAELNACFLLFRQGIDNTPDHCYLIVGYSLL